MKNIALVGLLFLLNLRGAALAQQAEEQQKGSSTGGMMQGMMSGDKGSEMMGQMSKMMGQCSAMMESTHPASGQTKEGEKK